MLIAAILLGLFGLVALTDGVVFHMWKYRLHERPESRTEHLLHTANGALFPLQIYLMFCVRPEGGWLWLLTATIALSFLLEVVDVFAERASRLELGGLSSLEYAMHFGMSGLRAAAVAVFYSTYEASAFAAPAALLPVPDFFRAFGALMLLPSIAIAALHLFLCVRRPQPELLDGTPLSPAT